MMDFL